MVVIAFLGEMDIPQKQIMCKLWFGFIVYTTQTPPKNIIFRSQAGYSLSTTKI